MRKGINLILAVVLLGMLSAGCISVETTVKVNSDGSGKIIEKIGLGKGMADFVSGMSGDTEEVKEPEFVTPEFLTREALEKGAKAFGEGVRFVSVATSEDDNMHYSEIVYAFSDVTKLGIDQNQGNRVSSPGGQERRGKEEFVRFRFSKEDDSSVLQIMLPEAEMDEGETSEMPQPEMSAEAEEMQLAMMKMMFKGLHFAMKVEFEGEIIDTNATYVDEDTITLMEMDFEKIVDDAERLKELNAKQPEGIEEVKELLRDVEGIKFEFERTVTVQFE